MKYVLPIAVVGIIAIAAIFFFTSQKTSSETISVTPTASEVTSAPTVATKHKDGTYEAEGNYVSPGGPRNIDVTVVLKGDIVTDATFTGHATDATTKRFQGEFHDNFKPMVVGKKIDDLHITKVAGSSLSPIGFTDALEKIKTEAAKGA